MYKIFSTFTGAGGLDVGFHGDFTFLDREFNRLPFETTHAVELNAVACNTLRHNHKYFKNIHIHNEDITKMHIPSEDGYDILLGGFPCVSFSTVGNRRGVDDSINGKLYESYVSFVEKLKPKAFIAENVKGIMSANGGEDMKVIVSRFESTGYNMTVKLVNFADYGVPQNRERVLFIGVRSDIKTKFIIPPPSHIGKAVSVEKAFKSINSNCVNNTFIKQLPSTTRRIDAIPEGGNFKDLPKELSIKATMSNIYRRLDRSKPAYTVLASGGGGTWTYHYKEPRALSNRERARLQGFPDDFIFMGSNSEVRRQIGNAVPPVGIYPFAKELLRVLTTVTCLEEYIF